MKVRHRDVLRASAPYGEAFHHKVVRMRVTDSKLYEEHYGSRSMVLVNYSGLKLLLDGKLKASPETWRLLMQALIDEADKWRAAWIAETVKREKRKKEGAPADTRTVSEVKDSIRARRKARGIVLAE